MKKFRALGREMGYWRSGYGLKAGCDMVFGSATLENKSILEIGGGKGIYCIWASIHGAGDVLNLEPLAQGSVDSNAAFINFRKLKERLELSQIDMLPLTIQDLDSADDRFDLILSYGSINHLDEDSCINLLHDKHAKSNYRQIFQKIARMLKKDGKIIILDASRHNYFGDRNKPNPIAKHLDWQKHQAPETWSKLLSECGFHKLKINWRAGSLLRLCGIPFYTKQIAYFGRSAFRLEMTLKK